MCNVLAGLRQLGAVSPSHVEAAAVANAAWLEDVVGHLLAVLALDRFADYVSDQVRLQPTPFCEASLHACTGRCRGPANGKSPRHPTADTSWLHTQLDAHVVVRPLASTAVHAFISACGRDVSCRLLRGSHSLRQPLRSQHTCLLDMQVVVPVRETAAQALAAVLQGASLCSLQRVLQLLACMYTHHEWHVRHGAYTGIKYLLASRWVAAGCQGLDACPGL